MQRKPKKTDAQRFREAFHQRFGAMPEELIRRKLAAGGDPEELQRRYDQLAAETGKRCHCKPILYAELMHGTDGRQTHVRRADKG